MKIIKYALLFVVAIALCAAGTAAQTKKPVPKKTVTPTTTVTNALEIKAGVDKVTTQINNVARFLYLLGSIAKGIEDIDKDTRANRTALDLNAGNKRAFIQTIRNLRAGIAALEVEFRTKLPLQKYLIQVQGITDLTAQSEDLAVAGKYTDSGRPLVALIGKLADALAALP